MERIKQFEVGKIYSMRSICDSNCVWAYKVIKRTACTVTLQEVPKAGAVRTNVINCRISKSDTEFYKAEAVSPLGKYSMSPTLTAEKVGILSTY